MSGVNLPEQNTCLWCTSPEAVTRARARCVMTVVATMASLQTSISKGTIFPRRCSAPRAVSCGNTTLRASHYDHSGPSRMYALVLLGMYHPTGAGYHQHNQHDSGSTLC